MYKGLSVIGIGGLLAGVGFRGYLHDTNKFKDPSSNWLRRSAHNRVILGSSPSGSTIFGGVKVSTGVWKKCNTCRG